MRMGRAKAPSIILLVVLMTHITAASSWAMLCEMPERITAQVHNPTQLRTALLQARAGHVIEVKSGHYRGDYEVTQSGEKGAPIVITVGDARFTDVLIQLKGSYITWVGGEYHNSQIETYGNNNRIARTLHTGGKIGWNSSRLNSAIATVGGARFNRIDHNKIEKWVRRGIRTRQVNENTMGNWIDHNVLIDMLAPNEMNGTEAIQLGDSAQNARWNTGTTVFRNVINHYNLESEAISVKSSHVNIIANRLTRAPAASIVIRAAKGVRVEGNLIQESRGIRVYGDDHLIIGNKVTGSGSIDVSSGDATWDQMVPDDPALPLAYEGAHPVARNVTLAYNYGTIDFGKRGTGGKMYYDQNGRQWPTDIRTYSNKGGEKSSASVKNLTRLDDFEIKEDKILSWKAGNGGPDGDDPFCPSSPEPPDFQDPEKDPVNLDLQKVSAMLLNMYERLEELSAQLKEEQSKLMQIKGDIDDANTTIGERQSQPQE